MHFEETQCANMTNHEAHSWREVDILLWCNGVDETADLLASRLAVYGDRPDNMRRTALIWSGFLGVTIKPWQVPVMMELYKLFRLGITPDYSDNNDDAKGWHKMFEEQMEADGTPIIHARTVEEYLERKNLGSQVEGQDIDVFVQAQSNLERLLEESLAQRNSDNKANDASAEWYNGRTPHADDNESIDWSLQPPSISLQENE